MPNTRELYNSVNDTNKLYILHQLHYGFCIKVVNEFNHVSIDKVAAIAMFIEESSNKAVKEEIMRLLKGSKVKRSYLNQKVEDLKVLCRYGKFGTIGKNNLREIKQKKEAKREK